MEKKKKPAYRQELAEQPFEKARRDEQTEARRARLAPFKDEIDAYFGRSVYAPPREL